MLEEDTRVELGQLDVTLLGPPALLSTLTKQDFEVWVNHRRTTEFLLDPLCSQGRGSEQRQALETPRQRRYLLYFDGPQLTRFGGLRSVQLARDLLPHLVRDESLALVVLNSRELRVLTPWTSDLATLERALSELEAVPFFATEGAEQEDRSIERLALLVNELHSDRQVQMGHYDRMIKPPRLTGDPLEALRIAQEERWFREGLERRDAAKLSAMASGFRSEEQSRTEIGCDRLSLALALLGAVPPPKIVLYFGDRFRMSPGDHYLSWLQATPRAPRHPDNDYISRSSHSTSFAQVVRDAAAVGARFYPVQAEGLVPSSIAIRDAQSTLDTLALETGGEAFLNGVPASQIAARLSEDMACLYLVSFSADDLPRDTPVPVRVSVRRPGVTARTRGQLVVQSDTSRARSSIFAEFVAATPSSTSKAQPVSVSLIPFAFGDGKYRALLQVHTPRLGCATYDHELAAILMEPETTFRAPFAGSDCTSSLLLEREVAVRPGRLSVLAMSHDRAQAGKTYSEFSETWPDPRKSLIGPIVIIQPRHATLDSGTGVSIRQAHPLATRAVDYDRPTVLVSLACSHKKARSLRVERHLEGETTVSFEPLVLERSAGECVQLRDLVPENVLGPGSFVYHVQAYEGDKLVSTRRAEFRVEPHGAVLPPATAAERQAVVEE